MNTNLEIKKDIYWVGALDYDIKVFDIIMQTDYGTTYNAYIVKGKEKTALIEISKETFFDEFLERVKSVCDPSEIDYIVVNHTEPDHTGALAKLLELTPNATIVGSQMAIKFLKDITNSEFKSQAVKDNDEIDLGGKTLKFMSVPNLHWPDSMYTYIQEENILFTCDSFGCHYCDKKVFNDEIENDFIDAYKYYFDCIMGPFKSNILNALDKIKDINIDIICPGHGPVLKKDIEKYIELYRTWATIVPSEKPSVVIAYVTSYGYTRKIAEKILEGVKSVGDIDVVIADITEISKDELLQEINNAKGLMIGTPTILADTLPPVWEILTALNPIIHKGKFGAVFGSYGWSGEAVKNVNDRLKQLRFKVPIEPLKVLFNPSTEQLESAFEFGEEFAKNILE